MGSVSERPPIWLLPRSLGSLPTLGTGNPRLALALAALGLVSLAPGFALLAPHSNWDREAVLVALLIFSFYAYVGAAHLRGTSSLDAAFVGALLGVVLLGPLAGALVFAAPELMRLATDRRLTSILGNLASFGWAALAAAWVLEPLGYASPPELGTASSYASVAFAGIVLVAVNYFYITAIDAVRTGTGVWFQTKREFIPTLPVAVPLSAAAAGTAFLFTEIGLAGLLPLAAIVFIPRLLVPQLMRDVPIRELSSDQATARYAIGLASVLGLSSVQRRVLRDAATHLGGGARLTRLDDFQAVMQTVLYSREPWAGGGQYGLRAGEIPIESRVLAVARTWASLTAQNGPGLTPREALVNLRGRAGQQLDPVVVAAAVRVVEDELIELGQVDGRQAAPIATAA